MRKLIGVVVSVLVVIGLFVLSGCGMDSGSAIDKENEVRGNAYESLQAKYPATIMDNSPTLDGINFFAETWGEDPNKLSYVYLMNMQGEVIGYYVLRGLPVSYCAQRFSPTQLHMSSSGKVNIPMPAIDGAYYSGGQCAQFYGRDATTDAYVEWSTTGGLSYLVHENPIGRPETDERALGPTSIEEVS